LKKFAANRQLEKIQGQFLAQGLIFEGSFFRLGVSDGNSRPLEESTVKDPTNHSKIAPRAQNNHFSSPTGFDHNAYFQVTPNPKSIQRWDQLNT